MNSRTLTNNLLIAFSIFVFTRIGLGHEFDGSPIFAWQVVDGDLVNGWPVIRTDGIRNIGAPGNNWRPDSFYYWHVPDAQDSRAGLYPQLYSNNYPLSMLLKPISAPLNGQSGANAIPVVLDELTNGGLPLDFALFDYELPDDVAEVTETARLIREHPNPNVNQAKVGGWAYYPTALDTALFWPWIADNHANEMLYREAGLNCAMPVAYPSDYDTMHASLSWWGDNLCPNNRACLFWAPLEHVSVAKRNLPTGHSLLPWVSGFVSWGAGIEPPPKDDNRASILHYRLRGADGYYGFNTGTPWDSDAEYQEGMLAQWKSLDAFFAGSGRTTFLNLTTNKTSGVQWSGAVRGSTAIILVSNLSNSAQSVSLPVGYGLPQYSDVVQPGAHVLHAYSTNGNIGPTVVLTEPLYGENVLAPTVQLAAAASDADGAVAKVEFYNGSYLLQTITTPPYSYVWTPGSPGAFTVTAKVYDNTGASSNSSPVVVYVNAPPVSNVVVPPAGATIVPGTAINLSTDASDDGLVKKVEFYADGQLVGVAGAPSQSGLQLWYKSDSGVIAHDRTYTPGEQYAMVSQWTDQSGMANNATSDGANAPWMSLATVGIHANHPVVHFGYQLDEVDLSIPKILNFSLRNAASYTGLSVFYVASKSNTYYSPDFETVINTGGPGSTSGVQWEFGLGPDATRGLGAGGTAGDVAFGTASFAQPDTFYSMSYVLNKGSGWSIRCNDSLLGEVADTSFPAGDFNGTMCNNSVWTQRLNGNLAEVLIYDHALTGAELHRVEDYLDDRYFRNPSYRQTWLATGTGTHTITSKVCDANDLCTTSEPVSVSVIQDAALRCYWNLNENTGSSATDSSSSNNNGTISGATWIPGKVGSGLQFNGTSNFIQRVSSNALPSAQSSQTEALWFYAPAAPTGRENALTVHGLSSSVNIGYLNATTFGVWRYGGPPIVTVTGALMPLVGQWHHVAYVKDGTSGNFNKLYLDGQLIASSNTPTDYGNATTIHAGCSPINTNFWSGSLDEIRVYSRALSAPEIASLVQLQQ